MNFMSAMKNSEQISIFSTDAISKLIEYKWRNLIYIGYAQALIYITFMIVMLFLHSDEPENAFYKTLLWGFLIYLTATILYSVVIGKLPLRQADPW